jgi:hypothetical protein
MFSHSEGESLISGCHFNHPFDLIANNRLIYLTGNGQVGSDSSYSGKITIENNTFEGFISQFVNHDNGQGSNFEVIVTNNDTRYVENISSGDTNAFFVGVHNNPDIYSKLTFNDNKLENKHVFIDNVLQNLGKGMFFLATGTLRTTSLPIFASGNILTNLILRSDTKTGNNSPPSLFTITETAFNNYTINPYNYTQTFIGNTTYYNIPISININADTENISRFQIIIFDIEFTNNEGIAYGINTGFVGVVSKLTILAFDSNDQPITDFSNNPINLTLELPNANPDNILKLYKLKTGENTLMDPQPNGYPISLTHQSEITWTATILSLSDFIIIDETPPSGKAGGDPHIININNKKITIPNNWNYVRLYEKDNMRVCVSCELISPEFIKKLHCYDRNNNERLVIGNKLNFISKYTFMKELDIFKNNNLILKYDLIDDKLLFGNNLMLEKINEKGLYSIPNNKYYPPKNISSYCIYLNNNNFLKITIDNYWDDINNVSLLFYDTNKNNYYGEFFNHHISNKNIFNTNINKTK